MRTQGHIQNAAAASCGFRRLTGYVLAAVLVLLTALPAMGQGTGVRLEKVSHPQSDAEPRQIVSITYRVSNETSIEREFDFQLDLPEGWSPVTPLYPFTLESESDKLVFVAFSIPPAEQAGTYSITARVEDTSSFGVGATYKTQVRVLPVARIEVRPPVGEVRILAGDEAGLEFEVHNHSNAASRFELTARSSQGWPLEIQPSSIRLEPDQNARIAVIASSDDSIAKEIRNRVTLNARSLDLNHGGVSAEATGLVVTFPRTQQGEMFETLDGAAAVKLAWEENEDLTGQLKLDLRDDLGEGRWGEIFFVGPYPGEWRGRRFVETDRFHLEYGREDTGYVSVGDDSLSVTPLTVNNYFSRGMDIEYRSGSATYRAFGARRRRSWTSERLLGLQLSRAIEEWGKVTLTGIDRADNRPVNKTNPHAREGALASLRLQLEPDEGIELDAEYGVGRWDDGSGAGKESDDAWRVAAKVDRGRVWFDGEMVRSGPDFPGYWQDSDLTRGHLSVQALSWLRVWGSVTDSEWNVEQDMLRSHPESAYRSAGVSIDAGWLGRPSVYRRWTRRINDGTGAWDERERTTVFELHRRIGDLSLTARAEDGWSRDLLSDTEAELDRFGLQFNWFAGNGTNLAGGWARDIEEGRYTGDRNEADRYWLNTGFDVGRKTEVDLRMTTSERGEGWDTWYSADISYELNKGKRLKLKAQHHEGVGDSETAVSAELIIPMSLEIPWLPRKGSLTGRLYLNRGRDQSLTDVILRVDGLQAATDENGRFSFPSLPDGDYELRIDPETLGFGLVPDMPGPIKVRVKAGQEQRLEVPMVESALIEGRVVTPVPLTALESSPALAAADYISRERLKSLPQQSSGNGEVRELPVYGVYVVLENEHQRLVRTTGPDGAFSFGELRPIEWKLSLAEGQFPKFFEVNPGALDLELQPGQNVREISFNVNCIERPLEITTTTASKQ